MRGTLKQCTRPFPGPKWQRHGLGPSSARMEVTVGGLHPRARRWQGEELGSVATAAVLMCPQTL